MSGESISIFPKYRVEQLEEQVSMLTEQLESERRKSEKHLRWAYGYKDQFVDMMRKFHDVERELFLTKKELKKKESSIDQQSAETYQEEITRLHNIYEALLVEVDEERKNKRLAMLEARKESDAFRKLLEDSKDANNSLQQSNYQLSKELYEL